MCIRDSLKGEGSIVALRLKGAFKVVGHNGLEMFVTVGLLKLIHHIPAEVDPRHFRLGKTPVNRVQLQAGAASDVQQAVQPIPEKIRDMGVFLRPVTQMLSLIHI